MISRSVAQPLTLPLRLLMLLAALLLAITPLALFAAPAAQDITADVVGTWESGESEDSEIVTIAFFEDGSLQGTSIYIDDETTIAYHGSWEATGEDTFTLAIEAVDGEEQPEAVLLNGEITRRGLRLPDSVGFDRTGMNLVLISDAAEPVADQLLGLEPTDEPADEPVINEEFVGVYSTGELETALEGFSTVNLTISLFDDGTMETTANFDDGAYVGIETGSWVDAGDGTLTLTYETTDGQPYDPPVPVAFEIDGDTLFAAAVRGFGEDGLLVTFTSDEPTRFDPDAVSVVAEEPAADEVGVEGLYVAGPIADDDTEDTGIMVWLKVGGFAQTIVMPFSGTSVPVSRVGVWEDGGDGTIIVTLEEELVFDGTDVAILEALDAPEEIVFAIGEDSLTTGGLMIVRVDAAQDLRSGVGEEAEATELVEEEAAVEEEPVEDEPVAEEEPVEDEPVAEEEAVVEEEPVVEEEVTTEPTATGTLEFDSSGTAVYISPLDQIIAGNIVSLVLMESGVATIAVNSSSGSILVTDMGTWEADGATITLTLTQDDQGAALAEPNVIVYTMQGDLLVSSDYDADRYGPDITVEISN